MIKHLNPQAGVLGLKLKRKALPVRYGNRFVKAIVLWREQDAFRMHAVVGREAFICKTQCRRSKGARRYSDNQQTGS